MNQVLWDLARKARQARSDRELGFLLVNETFALVPYRQSALWLEGQGTWALSGVVQVDANVPFVQWFESLCTHIHTQHAAEATPVVFSADDLPPELRSEWAQWWPTYALWVPRSRSTASPSTQGGGFVMLRDTSWTAQELELIADWLDIWWHAFEATHRPRLGRWRSWADRLRTSMTWSTDVPWWRQRRLYALATVCCALLFPVRMSVLAPGELVPANPTVVRAPLDGVIDVFHVQPNQQVQAGEALFGFDEMGLQSRLQVAEQALSTAQTDYRQTSQLALSDARSKAQLGLLAGKIEEKRNEIVFLQEQLVRARVVAPQPGVVLMDDPTEWIGRPVVMGERILRLAQLDDTEIEAWVPIGDALPLAMGADVVLYLSASPMDPVTARLRYLAHEAVQRPDGTFAYRIRATLAEATEHRIGLKGTAKLYGNWVPLGYWMLRRPMATLRATLGW